MDLELLNYINLDMKWTVMRKGRTSMTRRPRKPGADGFEPGSKIHESTAFERKKSGFDVVEKVVDASLKKRRLLHQSALPTPQTLSIHYEGFGQQCRSNPLSHSQKAKSKTRLRNSKKLKLTKKGALDRGDFSGIELLATVACSSFVHDDADHVEDFSISKEHTTPPGVDSRVDRKDAKSNDLPIQQNLHVNGKEVEENKVGLSKELRLHWDLNTVMDEWEEPCENLLIEPQLPVKQDAAISLVPLAENCNNGSVEEKHEIVEDLEEMSTKKININASHGESSASKSDVVDSLTHPVKCEDFSNSTTSVLMEQTVGNFESDRIDNPLVHSYSKVTVSKTDQQPVSEECCGSNVTQEEQGHMAEGDSEDKLQAGYDSPFEDGELRELIEKTEKDKDEFGTVENPLLVKVDHGQTTAHQTSLLVKEAIPKDEIKQSVQVDTFERPHFDESRKDGHDNESTSFDVCRNGEYVQRNRAWDLKSHRSLDSNYFRNYNPRGGSYRIHDRRTSPSERNNAYGSNRGPPPARSHSRDRYRFHSQEYHDPKQCYLERKPRFSPSFNRHGTRPRSRSRSGSPIAWHFQKRKNLDASNSGEIETGSRGGHVSPERSSKCFEDRRFTDGQFRDSRQSSLKQRFDPTGYPERLKPNDYFRYSQCSAKFSQMTGYRYKG